MSEVTPREYLLCAQPQAKHQQSVNLSIARRDSQPSSMGYAQSKELESQETTSLHPLQPFPALSDKALGRLEMLSCLSIHAMLRPAACHRLVKDTKRDGEDRQQQADGKASHQMT